MKKIYDELLLAGITEKFFPEKNGRITEKQGEGFKELFLNFTESEGNKGQEIVISKETLTALMQLSPSEQLKQLKEMEDLELILLYQLIGVKLTESKNESINPVFNLREESLGITDNYSGEKAVERQGNPEKIKRELDLLNLLPKLVKEKNNLNKSQKITEPDVENYILNKLQKILPLNIGNDIFTKSALKGENDVFTELALDRENSVSAKLTLDGEKDVFIKLALDGGNDIFTKSALKGENDVFTELALDRENSVSAKLTLDGEKDVFTKLALKGENDVFSQLQEITELDKDTREKLFTLLLTEMEKLKGSDRNIHMVDELESNQSQPGFQGGDGKNKIVKEMLTAGSENNKGAGTEEIPFEIKQSNDEDNRKTIKSDITYTANGQSRDEHVEEHIEGKAIEKMLNENNYMEDKGRKNEITDNNLTNGIKNNAEKNKVTGEMLTTKEEADNKYSGLLKNSQNRVENEMNSRQKGGSSQENRDNKNNHEFPDFLKENFTSKSDNIYGHSKNEVRFSEQIEKYNLCQQIDDKINIRHFADKGRLELSLEPEFLGKVKIELETKSGQIVAKFVVENEYVKNYLENNISVLQNNLTAKNIHFSEINIESKNSEANLNNSQFRGEQDSNGRQNAFNHEQSWKEGYLHKEDGNQTEISERWEKAKYYIQNVRYQGFNYLV